MSISRAEREKNLLWRYNGDTILSGIFGGRTHEQVEASVCFARYLSSLGVTRRNYRLFLKLLETNNRWIIDAAVGRRDATLLFSGIKPNRFLVRTALTYLSFFHPKQIYAKLLQAMMGILQYTYHDAQDGYRIHRLTVADLNSVGKFLDPTEPQDDPENREILAVLDHICKLGEYENDHAKSLISKHAFAIRFGYFDHAKRLVDVVPHVLLIKIEREGDEKKPSGPFIRFLESGAAEGDS